MEELTDYEIVQECEHRGYSVFSNTYYPHNSIIDHDLSERFHENYGKIDKQKLEQFLTEQGV